MEIPPPIVAQQLDGAPIISYGRRSARTKRMIVRLTLAASIGFAIILVWRYASPVVMPRLRLLLLQHRCSVWECADEREAYLTEPVQFATVISSADYIRVTRASTGFDPGQLNRSSNGFFMLHCPRAWRDFDQTSPLSGADWNGVVFLHARRSRDGNERIIIVTCTSPGQIEAQVLSPASLFDLPHDVTATKGFVYADQSGVNAFRVSDRTRFHVGHPDGANDARFFIPFVLNGKVGHIEGTLSDGTEVRFKLADNAPGAMLQAFIPQ
jgi:hypothetical protein